MAERLSHAAIQGGHDGMIVPEHFVPIPETISPEAQAFLAHTAPVAAMPLPSSLDDHAAWHAYRSAGDKGVLALTRAYAETYPADVSTHPLSAACVYEITPRNLAQEHERHAIVFVHGGGWITGGGDAAIYTAMHMAGLARMRVFSVDYRMVPEVGFPAPVEDVLEAYRLVLARFHPECVAMYGPSAGANLVPAAVLLGRDRGVPMPAACALHSCPSDITFSGDSVYTNYQVDTVLRERDPGFGLYYSRGHDPRDPLLSPLHADFSKGFPPTILTSGTRDLLLSPTVLLHRALRRAGIEAELHVWEAMTHCPFFGAPEEDEFYREHVRFMREHLR
ncbi:MAG: alpha/beta hydrolase fold domain-containing protein [Sphingomonadales bacterium]|nr:alpha/beta hydrolase fold domain-containing protein [Sphingomonadales bacterium]